MSKTSLLKLNATRAGIRATISMFLKSAEESKEQQRITEFTLALKGLEMKTKKLWEINEKILATTDTEQIEEEMVTTEMEKFKLDVKLTGLRDFQRELDDNSANINRNAQNNMVRRENAADESQSGESGCEDCDSRRKSDTEIHQQEINSEAMATGSQNVTGNVPLTFNSANYHRLPKLTLPTFDGNIQTWQTFWDSFESTVHYNCNLTDVQKFSYLKSQIEGEAARTIDGFALTNTNYTRAIDLLKERYGQKHKIIHATMQSLIQLPVPKNTLHSIRKFYDDMETKIRALESLGKPQENYGDVLVPIVLNKLPGEIREQLARQHGDDNWLLSDLRCAIFKEINIKEAGASNRPEVELYGSAASLFAGAKESSVTESTHTDSQQTRYTDSNQANRDATVLYTSARQSRSGVLLKTAITDVCYKESYSSAAVLFDEGTQRSFITETLANELKLPRESKETISLSAFGGSSTKVQSIDSSIVHVVTEQQQKIPIRVLIVPKIATPIDISHRAYIDQLPYLKGLKLAHPISDNTEFPISLLIGTDFYWDFIEDEAIRGCGPTAVKSKLGYLLSGPFNIIAPLRHDVQHILNVMTSFPRHRADTDHGTLLSDRKDISKRGRNQLHLTGRFGTRWKTGYITA